MKIEKLLIYGFGKHENVQVEIGPGMNVLYGLNEAGKTTIQQFILHILFGFPQKNSVLLRYEPKLGGKFGGQVCIVDETFGRCIIERVRGKSAGDVIVYFEDGRKGNEEDLHRILRQYDRSAFESIFSFSLLQLQDFEKMDGDELSRTLLASGTTGVDSMIVLEKRMEKENGDLFKKSGKNPEMNRKITELRELEKQLVVEQRKIEEYGPSIERISEIDVQLLETDNEQKKLQESLQQLTLTRQLLPLHHKKMVLEAQIVSLRNVEFPVDGIRRYEILSGKLTEAEMGKQRVEKELADLTARMPKNHEQKMLAELENLVAKESEWHSWQTVLQTAKEEKKRLTARKRNLFERLGANDEMDSILLTADVSLRKEEEMHVLIEELAKVKQNFAFTESQLNDAENEWTNIKEKLVSIERTQPTFDEMNLGKDWPTIRQQLAEAKAYVSFRDVPVKKQPDILSGILLLLSLVVIVFGFSQTEWLFIAIGILIGSLGIFLYFKKESIQEDQKKMRKMKGLIEAYDGKEQHMEELTDRIDKYKRDMESYEELMYANEQKRDVFVANLDSIHKSRTHLEAEFGQFIQQYGFDGLPSPTIVPELFNMIREAQNIEYELEENKIQLQKTTHLVEKRLMEVEVLLQQSVPQNAVYEIVRREFSKLSEAMGQVKTLTLRKEQAERDLQEKLEMINLLEEKLKHLFAEANVETEEELYSAFSTHQQQISLQGQLTDVNVQMAMHGEFDISKNLTIEEVTLKEQENKELGTSIHEKRNQLINEKAILINKTERLMTDDRYGQQLQLFEMKKDELVEMAKKWSERKAISESIKRTMAELKEKKLPEVLRIAEQIFKELTDGRYLNLEVTEDSYFEVVSYEGMRYPIIELSQATKEQAYISLRLALASSLSESAPFPIIMDDPFVHFDAERLLRMIELLDGLQTNRQFIYFTCHEKMRNQWPGATAINVSELRNEQGAIV
ncbi:ATP-binding protein [Sporosarcina sp. CAU 1771]